MTEEPILFELIEGVARITLNRPEKVNAFTRAMLGQLIGALDRAAADAAVRAVLIDGAGRNFCSGQDLGEAIDPSTDVAAAMDATYNPLMRRLAALDLPVVAAVQGVAAGAGASLALAADLVLAGRSAQFIQAFTSIGLMPDAGGTWILPRLMGSARALGLTMLGEPLPAETALAWGLIWRVVDDEAVPDEAMALARRLAARPTRALGALRRAMRRSWDNSFDQQLDLERDQQQALARTADFAEGVAAFLGKRPPRFRGR